MNSKRQSLYWAVTIDDGTSEPKVSFERSVNEDLGETYLSFFREPDDAGAIDQSHYLTRRVISFWTISEEEYNQNTEAPEQAAPNDTEGFRKAASV